MIIIEHARLVIHHRLDTVELFWGDATDGMVVESIIADPETGYTIVYIDEHGNPETLATGALALRDSDIHSVSPLGTDLMIETMRLSLASGENASTLLVDFGIDVEELNLKLLSDSQTGGVF